MGNSVIYRPAYDAEVEYLESDGNSYIDTGLKASSELGILAHIYVTGIFPFGGRNGLNNKEFSFCALQNGDSGFRFGSSIAIAQGIRVNELYEFDNTQNHNILKVGNTSYVATYNSFISDYNVFLFGLNNAGVAENISSRIYDFKIYNNSTLVRDYIPVRIGQVGYMYDKVSKQLFANKGTGNFILGNDVSNAVIPQQRCVLYFGNQRSVGFERIYEEYEWLKGDGTAYIDTLVDKLKGTITVDIDRTAVTSNSNILGREAYPGLGFESRCVVNLLRNNYIAVADIYGIRTTSGYGVNIDMMDTLYLDLVAKIASTKSGNSTSIDIGTDIGGYNMLLFAKNRGSAPSYCWSGSIGSFKMADVIDLTPVRLLRPIPAILDGNGIARQAGECGMWDKVSNKFYGNVANSGTFTVKGPKCYEEYEWLVATIPVNTTLVSLPINSNNVSFIRKTTRGVASNINHFITNGYSYYTSGSNMDYLSIWSNSDGQNMSGGRTVGNTMSFEATDEYLKVNGMSVTQYGFPISRMSFSNAANAAMQAITKTSSIIVNGSVRYAPCKLTHGIPASMDANGIARPAGTCGMWDKVNDVFYGNVANSGSFTVSND